MAAAGVDAARGGGGGLIDIIVPVFFPEGERGVARKQDFLFSLATWQRYLLGSFRVVPVHDGPLPQGLDLPEGIVGEHRRGIGASLNLGFARAFEQADVVIHFIDDFRLTTTYDLAPWVELLREREDIGIVNLSAPFPNCTGTVAPLGTHTWGILLNRHNIAAGLRPAVYHQRFFEFYGPYDECVNAWECERLFNERFCQRPEGPHSVLALPFPWECTSSIETGQEEPCA